MDKKIFVSIIMPAYNAERFIEESIVSVQNQTFKNWELIIVNDGSTDSTAKIIGDWAVNDKRVFYIYQENKRLGAARNTAIRAARGEWIAFIDSDDLWMPEKLEKQLEVVNQNKVDVVFTNGFILDDSTKELRKYDTFYGNFSGDKIYKLLFNGNFIPVLSVLMKRSFIEVIGFQDESAYAYGCEDWDYWLRLSKSGAIFYGMDNRLFTYRIHENGMSQNLFTMTMAECYLLYKNLDRSLFKKQEYFQIKRRFFKLIQQIIPGLFKTNNKERLSFYLNILSKVSYNYKYNLAKLLFKTYGFRSKKIVTFLLFH